MRDGSRREPWPVILTLMLVTMMGVSISFYVIASSNPDPVVQADAR